MTAPTVAPDTSGPIRVAYRLTIEDVRRFVEVEDRRSWIRAVRSQKASTALILGLVLGLSGLCGLGLGYKSGLLILGWELVLLGAFGWARVFAARRRGCRLARDLGIPCDLRVAFSPLGILKASGPGPGDPGRRFPWSEAAGPFVAPGLVVFRLRPAEGVLLIPDHAFASSEAKLAFADQARRWRDDASIGRPELP